VIGTPKALSFSIKTKVNSDPVQTDETLCSVTKARQKRTRTVRCHFHEVSEIVKATETEKTEVGVKWDVVI
jgi:hypothetical protein